ncbi:MAG: tail fiber protein [Candidatus Thiodiazotropha sp. (ex Dulcina madagascariensis)]|nr:tail fiber protein [Candidatus Thiodiazotropha sp. (ex Epidulcina cf. delphinae)]MCU7924123.1 tail fiber protein [Candidatus Thiodiazotropha sp. (ex Dulcina madagascariensis)]MCU7928776.1 tail fiber protein [Candidatus Thiodiazotropha sp. (ex Dulcina madagascariensis)]
MTPYMSQINIFGFTFAPRNWALCDGAILAINDNQALYALIGTNFGGDGTTTFGLPDFRGRVPVCLGTSHAYSYQIGLGGGYETVSLNAHTMPTHDHDIYAVHKDDTSTNTSDPAGKMLATSPAGKEIYNTLDTATMKPMSSQAISVAGAGQGHANVQPSLVVNFCMALQGTFPPRN